MIKKKLLKKIGNVKAYLIDGDLIRRTLSSTFKECGIRKIYGFIPKNEIWIDSKLSSSNRSLVLLKALREYNLAMNGMKIEHMNRSVEPILAKCARHPLLVIHRIKREEAKINRREKRLW